MNPMGSNVMFMLCKKVDLKSLSETSKEVIEENGGGIGG